MEIIIRNIIPIMLIIGIITTFLRWRLKRREAVIIILDMFAITLVLVFGELYRYFNGLGYITTEEYVFLFLTYLFRSIACILFLILILKNLKANVFLILLQFFVAGTLATGFFNLGFSFDSANQLQRGFAVYFMWGIAIVYILFLIGYLVRSYVKKTGNDDYVTLYFIVGVMIAGTVCEIFTDICEIYAISILVCLMYWLYHYNIVITKKEVEQKNKELIERQTMVMVSQIQPHFLYNTLSAIMAISSNPPETTEALGNFGKYLRGNLDTKTLSKPIHFTREMEHVRVYLSLEKLRFGDRVEIVEDITACNFFVPPLSVQMLVENAVKHGITARENGGRIIISTSDTPTHYRVRIKDNGVGFDVKKFQSKEGVHIGLNNVKFRLNEMLKGELIIESELLEGTTVTMLIPKK